MPDTRSRYTSSKGRDTTYHRRKKRRNEYVCHCCRKAQPFCWTCKCGFQICLPCMQENQWGLSGNSITWICPDCGELRGI